MHLKILFELQSHFENNEYFKTKKLLFKTEFVSQFLLFQLTSETNLQVMYIVTNRTNSTS